MNDLDPSVILPLVLGGLLLSAVALGRAVAAIGALVAELLGALLASLRALAVVCLLIVGVVFVAFSGSGDAVGTGTVIERGPAVETGPAVGTSTAVGMAPLQL